MRTVIIFRNVKVFVLFFFLVRCTYYENDPIKLPVPDISDPTETLEAKYVTAPPNKISSPYWKTADYLPINSINQVTGEVPIEDGLFNMSGTYNGLTDFNLGDDPDVIMKAAYTQDSIYILISWKDTIFNASQGNWFFDGPTDPLKEGSTSGWTSQQGDDNFKFLFDIGSGKKDVWHWSLSLSEPLGFAIDLYDNGSGTITPDAGNKTFVRNAIGDNRSGPQYDWNGNLQEIVRVPGGYTILDPGYYLYNKKSVTGDAALGDVYYQDECALCHGTNGDGSTGADNPVGVRLNKPAQFNRWTLTSLIDFASDNSQHEGAIHFPSNSTDQENLFTRLRGFSGIPGYYLQNPTGSNSDVRSVGSTQLAKIDTYNKRYTVLIMRALNTGNDDDISFDPSQTTYNFNFFLSDNDVINNIGSTNQVLTFK